MYKLLQRLGVDATGGKKNFRMQHKWICSWGKHLRRLCDSDGCCDPCSPRFSHGLCCRIPSCSVQIKVLYFLPEHHEEAKKKQPKKSVMFNSIWGVRNSFILLFRSTCGNVTTLCWSGRRDANVNIEMLKTQQEKGRLSSLTVKIILVLIWATILGGDVKW